MNRHPDLKVLDHGYVTLVESWGSDERIIEAARMSTDKGFLGWGPLEEMEDCKHCGGTGVIKDQHPHDAHPREMNCIHCVQGKVHKQGDEKLLAYLWNNKHSTPFEMAGLVLEIKAPIFVFREHHRHRTQSYNEMSARYTPLPNENYVPSLERLMINAGQKNKQAGTIKGSQELTEANAMAFRNRLQRIYRDQQTLYEEALNAGVPKELARAHLPVGRYSKMRASANLRNWLAFLTLRQAPAAQWEIRQYANAISTFVKQSFPRTHELFAGEA